jgi:hypothetical protein
LPGGTSLRWFAPSIAPTANDLGQELELTRFRRALTSDGEDSEPEAAIVKDHLAVFGPIPIDEDGEGALLLPPMDVELKRDAQGREMHGSKAVSVQTVQPVDCRSDAGILRQVCGPHQRGRKGRAWKAPHDPRACCSPITVLSCQWLSPLLVESIERRWSQDLFGSLHACTLGHSSSLRQMRALTGTVNSGARDNLGLQLKGLRIGRELHPRWHDTPADRYADQHNRARGRRQHLPDKW